MMYRLMFEVQKFLSLQPDAKVANGVFWATCILGVAYQLLSIVS